MLIFMKKLLIILIIFSVSLADIYSQERTVAFHIYNPLGLFQKAGGKIEFRTNQMGFLLGAIQYYGSLPSYPGTQFGLEWRHYSIAKPEKKSENFLYTKLIAGHQEHLDATGDGFFAVNEVPEGNYYGAGAGIGKHINYGHFFTDFNAGLKFVLSNVKQESTFYLSGPASYLDLHFNLGFQF